MRAQTLLTLTLSTLASLATAQTGTSGCVQALDNIVNTCLGGEGARLNACEPNEWDCMCTAQRLVLRCYNDCPSDPRRSSAESVQIQYCDAAAQYGASALASQSAAANVQESTSALAAQSSILSSVIEASTVTQMTSETGSAMATASAAGTESVAPAEQTDSSAAALKPVGALAAIFGAVAML